ncbi:MAG: hypothetical protein VKK94_00305 [Cyanobacteriota bacterium]|nr:hypothetical protein [Cyanobacteriota bacterium]
MPFHEVQSQGYGSHWWSMGDEDARSNPVVVFAGNEVVRGTRGFLRGERQGGPQRMLLIGMGSALWYGRDPSWREKHDLIAAGEGFWRSSEGCRILL